MQSIRKRIPNSLSDMAYKKNWERLYNIAFRDDDDYFLFQFGFLNFTHLYRYLHVVEVL